MDPGVALGVVTGGQDRAVDRLHGRRGAAGQAGQNEPAGISGAQLSTRTMAISGPSSGARSGAVLATPWPAATRRSLASQSRALWTTCNRGVSRSDGWCGGRGVRRARSNEPGRGSFAELMRVPTEDAYRLPDAAAQDPARWSALAAPLNDGAGVRPRGAHGRRGHALGGPDLALRHEWLMRNPITERGQWLYPRTDNVADAHPGPAMTAGAGRAGAKNPCAAGGGITLRHGVQYARNGGVGSLREN